MQIGSAMLEQKKVSVFDGNVGLQLDPQLWKELPQELLERVIAKLPFSNIVAFRTVCKLWCFDIIPRAAAHVEVSSSRSALLYFDFFRNEEESNGSPWWMQVDKTNGFVQKFQQKSFPSPRLDEDVELIDSQDGLLVFGFSERGSQMLCEIVVCNPVTGKTKSLGLPHRIKFGRRATTRDGIVGVVSDKERGNYSLVTLGVDESGQYIALLYNSSTCTWKNSTSVLQAGADLPRRGFWTGRSVFCNGNLYWLLKHAAVKGNLYPPQYVLEFNSAKEQWRIGTVEINSRCAFTSLSQMAAFNGAIVLWHLNAFNRVVQTVTEENVDLLKLELFGPNFVSGCPESMRCRCGFELPVDPQVNPMQHYMPHYIERVDRWISIYKKLGYMYADYVAFSQQTFVYHALRLTRSTSSSLAIVVHDTTKNSYVELPAVPQERFPSRTVPIICNPYSRFSPSNVRSFSPSLTSSP